MAQQERASGSNQGKTCHLDDINGAGSGPVPLLREGVDMGEPADSLPLKPWQLGQNMLPLCT